MRRLFILLLLSTPLLLGACAKKPRPVPVSVPAAPPAPDYFKEGEERFESGNFDGAAAAYEKFLNGGRGAHRDKAMFRLALTHYLPDTSLQDPQRARTLLRRMVEEFPASPYRSQAEFILDLENEIEGLRMEAAGNVARIEELMSDMERMRGELLHERQTEVGKLQADLRERDEKIKRMSGEIEKLATELEKLKKIDMERRPSRPQE